MRGGTFATESQILGQKKIDLNLGSVQVECKSFERVHFDAVLCLHSRTHTHPQMLMYNVT